MRHRRIEDTLDTELHIGTDNVNGVGLNTQTDEVVVGYVKIEKW